MFENKQKNKIFLIDLLKRQCVREFADMDEVIECIALGMTNDVFVSVFNKLYFSFDDSEINMNGKDKKAYRYVSETSERLYCLRKYMFVDSYNRIVDIRHYKSAIKKRYEEIIKEPDENSSWDEFQHGDKLFQKAWFSSRILREYRFRCEPVPDIHKSGKYGSGYRSVKTFSELRENACVENKGFIRPKRRHIPTAYDDIKRNYQKNWKKQSKKKKQWMK